MKNMRLYAWIEFIIWLIVLAIIIFGLKFHNKNIHKDFKRYQIFISDADGLIVGSPVRYAGVQIGYVNKIQIISSNVYIRFIVTEKDFELPEGVIATVEGSGLGGSKSIEIYPPDPNTPAEKIIYSKDPVRLNRVMGLFKNIFKELDEIITVVGISARKIGNDKPLIEKVNELRIEEVKAPIDLDKIDKNIDSATRVTKDLNEKIQKIKRKEHESEQDKTD